MDWRKRVLCYWPGLARLWLRGDWVSLVIACAFTALFNLAIVSSFIWPQLLGPNFPSVIWPVLALVWLISYWMNSDHWEETAVTVPSLPENLSERLDTLFIRAQEEYLKGDWAVAEQLLQEQLRLWPRDAEARLLLATLFRHRQRWTEALSQLDRLSGIDEGLPWQFEISQERTLIAQLQSEMGDGEIPEFEEIDTEHRAA